MDNEQQPKNFKTKKIVKVIPAKDDRMRDETDKPKIRTAAYCRVSSGDEDQQTSYTLQVKHYTQYIKKNKEWEFSGIYADEGISGTSIKNRTNFQKMIEDCKAGKIDLVITKSISRFARNTLDCIHYVRMLKSLPSPVGVYFEKENLDSLDSKSEFILTILSSLAQDESRNISENVKWANQKRFQQGKFHLPTRFFLGYDKDKQGNLVINEEQAATVRRIYREYLEGYGTETIARRLVEDEVKTGRGKTKWSGASVRTILINEKYCGDIIMQKYVTVDFLTHRRVANRGQQPQYLISDNHPAIISKEDWNAVQVEMERRAKNYKCAKTGTTWRQDETGVFSNKLFCETCGEAFIRRKFSSTRNNITYYYPAWRCRTSDGRIEGLKCKSHSYREEAMKSAFMSMLQSMKHEKAQFRSEAEAKISEIDLEEWENDRVNILESKIESLNNRLKEISSSINDRYVDDIYSELEIDIIQEIDVLQNELKQLLKKKNEAHALRNSLGWLMCELDKINEFDPTKELIAFREDIFRRFVQSAIVHVDGNITYELIFGIYREATGNGYPVWKIEGRKNKLKK
jgi:DNA invertase Pin-like site-specific DNA recombinase